MNKFIKCIASNDKHYCCRRTLAIFFALSFDVLSIIGIMADDNNWQVYIPAVSALIAVISLLYLTSKDDWIKVIKSLPSKKQNN
ncbi:MAG: hypothetical protein LBD17_04185 [Endomicrobium sp.]|jgi:hypothetical protein|nr:hypothetical protein [Endomicrobium sp.]